MPAMLLLAKIRLQHAIFSFDSLVLNKNSILEGIR
jgi:hypothetical protein